ncbi:hypothetical protein F4778DRAFT_474156 [Xylariomycetidae sp. FL2044]|nr:hypothetical protein F4778DRAFT_474156 [Xylariomycetidae sp. FL2044]
MAVSGTPRSVTDATRFTTNTPHAATKSSPSPSSSATSSSSTPSSSPPHQQTQQPPRRPGMPPSPQQETLEERVRRLRSAHLAARKADISRFDRVVSQSRRFFDAAHKVTVMGLIGFSGLALFVTVYATGDMMIHNRKRRNEFFAMQKQLRTDSLEAARLAYINGTATEEQISLVEEATEKAKVTGSSLPSLLSAPQTAAPPVGRNGTTAETSETPRSVWPGESMTESNLSAAAEVEQPKKKGLTAWLFGGLKKEEVQEDSGASDTTTNKLDFSREEAAASGRIANTTAALKDKAKAAFESEKENQRRGGPLDRLGLAEGKTGGDGGGQEKKRGWW